MHCTLQGDQDTLDNFRKEHNSGGDGDNVLQTDLDLSNFQFQPTQQYFSANSTEFLKP